MLPFFLLLAALTGLPSPQFRAESELVLVPVSVTDRNGRPVADLSAADFKILDEGQSRQIEYFEKPAQKASVLLVIDASSSMSGGLEHVQALASRFVQASSAADEIGLIVFDRQVRVRVAATSDRGKLLKALATLRPEGGTALFDGIEAGLKQLAASGRARRSLVILSDGVDHDSTATLEAVEKRLGRSDVVLFSIGEFSAEDRRLYSGAGQYFKQPPLPENLNPIWVLERLADVTGGRSFLASDADGVLDLVEGIPRVLANLYLLGFRPPVDHSAGGFRDIEVEIVTDRAPGSQVRHRLQYLASP